MTLSFLGPDGCAITERIDGDDLDGGQDFYCVTPLKVIAGPNHWELRAEIKRRHWQAELSCARCGLVRRFGCALATCPNSKPVQAHARKAPRSLDGRE